MSLTIAPYPVLDVLPPGNDSETKLVNAAKQRLWELLVREELGSNVEAIVIAGRPKVEIVRDAEQKNLDLIVIGEHGNHGLVGLLDSTCLLQRTHSVMTV